MWVVMLQRRTRCKWFKLHVCEIEGEAHALAKWWNENTLSNAKVIQA